MGIHRAWPDAEITGVDIKPQPRYPFNFVQGDALEADLSGYDFVWASPPCQAYSIAANVQRSNGKLYPDLLATARSHIMRSGKLYVIENVPGSPIRGDVMLCGSMFGLNLVRHRYFETNFQNLILTPPCQHPPLPVTVCGEGTPSWIRARLGGRNFTSKEKREAMGIAWTNRVELSQAIPPAYSEFLCRQFPK